MSHVLTISGPRGGSGKSVTALNLSASMGLYKKKVLLVDCDPLGTVTGWAGVAATTINCDLSSVLKGRIGLHQAVIETRFPSLDVLPGGSGLFPVSQTLSRTAANEKIFKLLMEDVRQNYDFIILDSPSSFGYLSIAAMAAADCLIAALRGHPGWIGDFHALLKSIQYIQQSHGTGLKLAGISLNRCDTTHGREDQFSGEQYAGLKKLLYEDVIPWDKAVDEAIDRRVPLVQYDLNAPAARAYLGLAREIILSFN